MTSLSPWWLAWSAGAWSRGVGRELSGWRERGVKKTNDVKLNSGDLTKKSKQAVILLLPRWCLLHLRHPRTFKQAVILLLRQWRYVHLHHLHAFKQSVILLLPQWRYLHLHHLHTFKQAVILLLPQWCLLHLHHLRTFKQAVILLLPQWCLLHLHHLRTFKQAVVVSFKTLFVNFLFYCITIFCGFFNRLFSSLQENVQSMNMLFKLRVKCY